MLQKHIFLNIIRKDIFSMFTVSGYEFEKLDLKNIIVRLNDNEYKREYPDWMDIWGS